MHKIRNALVITLALIGLATLAWADSYVSPATGRVVRKDPTELPASPSDWVKIDPADEARIRAIYPRHRKVVGVAPWVVEMTPAEKAGAAAQRANAQALSRFVMASRRLADLTRARSGMAGKDQTRINALVSAATRERDAALAALP